MPENTVSTLFAAIALMLTHVFAARLAFIESLAKQRWLSFAGGVAVAYVFVHLLPELAQHQEAFHEAGFLPALFLERHVYLVALTGLAVFYGLERLARANRRSRSSNPEMRTGRAVFWIHMASFSLYNALIGYILLHREETSVLSLVFFAIAIGLHFLMNDISLREHHKDSYHNIGRWILTGAIAIGWAIGLVTEISAVALAVLIAFVAGGIILNVLKEELPQEEHSRFWAFAGGAAVYSALLVVT